MHRPHRGFHSVWIFLVCVPLAGAQPSEPEQAMEPMVPEQVDNRGPSKKPGGMMTGLLAAFAPPTGQMPTITDFRFAWFPAEQVARQSTDLEVWKQQASIRFPLYQDGIHEWSGVLQLKHDGINTQAVLPTSGRPFPQDLWDIKGTLAYRYRADNDWIWSGQVFLGSASNQPFQGIREMQMGGLASLAIPSNEHNAWIFSLYYSPTSELNFPLPGIAYLYRPCETFVMNLGLPFLVKWQATEDLSFDFTYMVLRTIHAQVNYRVLGPAVVYAAYDWSNESWFLADRVEDRDRFFSYDMRISAGLKTFLSKQCGLDLTTGYAFDRFYFQGRNYQDRAQDRVNVGDGVFLQGQFFLLW